MHTLHLLRHAKSSWKDDTEDHARPLSKRGREAAQRVGEDLPAALGAIDLVLCSSARRALQTSELVLAEFATQPPCLVEDALYLADGRKLLDRLRQLDERITNVLLIGHNPGLQELAAALAEPGARGSRELAGGKFPTGARASFAITAAWSALGDTRHRLVGYVTPASLPGGKG